MMGHVWEGRMFGSGQSGSDLKVTKRARMRFCVFGPLGFTPRAQNRARTRIQVGRHKRVQTGWHGGAGQRLRARLCAERARGPAAHRAEARGATRSSGATRSRHPIWLQLLIGIIWLCCERQSDVSPNHWRIGGTVERPFVRVLLGLWAAAASGASVSSFLW